jgi:hypothetical protein
MNATRITGAVIAALAITTAAAACGSARAPSTGTTKTAVAVKSSAPTAAEIAIRTAVAAECRPAQGIDTSVSSAATIGAFEDGVGGWESQLTSFGSIPLTGVPDGPNTAREIALDYAKANLALLIGAEHDNPFGSGFSARKVRKAYSLATSALQDVLNRCEAAGD